jgi:hypothetical protein
MRNYLIACILFAFQIGTAQEKNEEKTEEKNKNEIDASIYFIAVNAHFQDNINLNNNLQASDVVLLDKNTADFVFGFNVFGKKYSSDFEFGFGQNKKENLTSKNKNMQFTGRIRFHYNLINKTNFAFTSGLSLAGTSSEVDLYSKNNTIDFNNLNPNTNGGLLSIRNQMFYAGPSLSIYLFKDKFYKFRLNCAYELAFTNGKWKSDYGNIANSINERNNNRFVVGLVF